MIEVSPICITRITIARFRSRRQISVIAGTLRLQPGTTFLCLQGKRGCPNDVAGDAPVRRCRKHRHYEVRRYYAHEGERLKGFFVADLCVVPSSTFRILRGRVGRLYGWSCQCGRDYAGVGPSPGHRTIHPYQCAACISARHGCSRYRQRIDRRLRRCSCVGGPLLAQARYTRRADRAVCEDAQDHRGEDAEGR